MATLLFESPIVFDVLDDRGETYTDELTAPDEVCEALAEDIRREMAEMRHGLADFGGPADHIGLQVRCNRQTGRPQALVVVNMPDYDQAILDELEGYIEGQFADGWGEGYEQTPFYEDYEGNRWHAKFWNRDNWYFKQV